MLCIDKLVSLLKLRVYRDLFKIVIFFGAPFVYAFWPYTNHELYVEGVITQFETKGSHIVHKGRTLTDKKYVLTIDGVTVEVPFSEEYKFDKRVYSGYVTFVGKYAKIYYLDHDKFYTSVELDDGSYSYHDPYEHDPSSYDNGLFPFLWFALITFFSVLVFARYYYLLMFASDERRKAVFGDPDYLPKD